MENVETEKISSNDRFAELIEQFWWGYNSSTTCGIAESWERIVFGYETLVDNACDPNSKYLEWREDIAKFLEDKNDNND
jgi:hypothetical protein